MNFVSEEDMNKRTGSTVGSSATQAGNSSPVVPSPISLQSDPPLLPPPNSSTVGDISSSIDKPSDEAHFCPSTATALDVNPRDTSLPQADKEIALPGKISEPRAGVDSYPLGSKEAQFSSCGNLATTSTPPRPSMGVAGSIYTRRRYPNNVQGEDESKGQEIDQTSIKVRKYD